MRNRIEVFTLFEEHFASILLPVVAEVLLDVPLKLDIDVEAAPIGLVLDTTNQVEPLLQLLLVVALILTLNRNNDVLELVHQNGEESHAKDLDDATQDFFHDGNGA